MKKRIIIWIKLIFCYVSSFFGTKARILNSQETIDYLIQNNKSIIRLGDGEFNFYLKKDIHYQKWNLDLFNDLKQIKDRFENNYIDCEYILAVPYTFFKKNGFFLAKKRVYVSSWSFSRYIFKKNFKIDNIFYGDSFLFSQNNKSYKDKLFNNNKDAIFIHNNKIYADNFAQVYNRKTYFIKCQSKEAYSDKDSLLSEVRKCILENNLEKRKLDIIISAGPAGKSIAYYLCIEGYRCLDTGHCWDEPLIIN